MKTIIVISMGSFTADAIANQIRNFLGEYIKLDVLLMSEIVNKEIQCDLVIFTSDYVADASISKLSKNTPYLIAKRVINHRNIKKLISLPQGTEVLLVNDGSGSAYEAIEQLMEIGLDHVKYYGFYPGCDSFPNLETAITPGETWLVPNFVKNTINIGSRILDVKTIHEITSMLELEELLQESLVNSYIRDIVEISKAIDENRKSAIESEKLMETILNSVESGIAYIDAYERIVTLNSKFEAIFGLKRKNILQKKLSKVIDFIDVFSKDSDSLITVVQGKEILIDVEKISFENNSGFLVTVSYTDKISKLDHKIRKNNEKKISRKLYTFEDYLTVNKEVKELLKRAEKFSKTNATILIQGENGTGKEILAQGIHSTSYRRKNAFIPINITAISQNLLESELFGYEEGSFTGAVKGGKAGLFEMANGGTIFIDEIGDAPLDFQVKLLRVLEEKRVRKVGALEEIPIDVRVIAATNKNLLKLVEDGTFREDLFFRLNILPLKTIPLRYREDDLEFLLLHYINVSFGKGNIKNLEDLFYKRVIEFFKEYKWRGNVRELVNLVEYLSFIYEGDRLDINSLNHYMIEAHREKDKRIILSSSELWVLREVEKYSESGVGRSVLTKNAKEQGVDLGEGKIRTIIKRLEELNLVKHNEKKKGCFITKDGLKVIRQYE